MNQFMEFLVASMIVVGAMFILVGSLGLIKLPTLMSRMHAPSKATTVGVGGCLLASMVQLWFQSGIISIQEVLITLFLFITAPVTAHFIAKAHIHLVEQFEQELPALPASSQWSTIHYNSADDSRDSEDPR